LLLEKILASIHADVVAVNVKTELLGEKEKLRLTSHHTVAGLRRLYSDLAELTLLPKTGLIIFLSRPNFLNNF
jgi:hypothetical protein